ncbi:MAG TPA: alpha/beta fold hydrolase [Jiangellales bacterium]|nr:alpha/beta fold hydrolase [Jiangellales bacterium]
MTAWAADGTPLNLSGARQRALLGALLARAGDVVPAEALVHLLWGDEPPRRPTAALQSQVHRLRRALLAGGTDAGELRTRPPGYALVVPADEVDARLFLELTERARRLISDDPVEAVAVLDRALGLWRGPAYAGVEPGEAIQLDVIRLEEARVLAAELRGEALVAAGAAAEAVPELEAFVAEHPLREGARASLLRGLYALGRHADALASYQQYRLQLADELGLEPGTAMQRLEQDILRHEMGPAFTRANATGPTRAQRPATGPAARTGLDAVHVRYLTGPQGGPIAYGSTGSGPRLVAIPGWVSSIDVIAAGRDPRSSLLHRLTDEFTVVLYDRAGTGLSRGVVRDHGLAASTAELVAVVDRIGAPVSLLAMSQAGPVAVALAAERPELVDRLVLFGTYADGPSVFQDEALRTTLVSLIRAHWGMGSSVLAELYRPRMSAEAARHMARVLRDSADPDVAADYLEAIYETSVADMLPRVSAPALVVHYRNDRVIPFHGGQQLAAGLPAARFVALDGGYHLPDAGDLDRIVADIRSFLAP